jgi:hypothetical protein
MCCLDLTEARASGL